MKDFASSEPVRLLTSVFVGIQVLLGAAAVSDLLGPKVVGFSLAAIAAVQVAAGEYVRSRVTPV